MALVQPYQNVAQEAFDFWAKPVLKNPDGSYYCPGFEGNTYASNPWDFIRIAGIQSPGICNVDVQMHRDVDTKKPAGSNGATTTVHGIQPAPVSIEITIWTPEQLRQLKAMWDQIFPAANKSPLASAAVSSPLTIGLSASQPQEIVDAWVASHPALQVHNINALVITGASGPARGSIVNSRVFRIDAIQYLPPSKRKATATPKAAKVQPIGSRLDAPQANAPGTYPTPGSSSRNTGP